MKLQKFIILAAALMAGTAGAATHKVTVTPIQDEKKKERSALYHFARMVIAGSLSGFSFGIATKGFEKLMQAPYELTKIDAAKAAGDKNSYLGGYPVKVLFPIAGALGIWLYCYLTSKDKGCMSDADEANILTGLPKKDGKEPHDVDGAGAHCPSCSCGTC